MIVPTPPPSLATGVRTHTSVKRQKMYRTDEP